MLYSIRLCAYIYSALEINTGDLQLQNPGINLNEKHFGSMLLLSPVLLLLYLFHS